MILELKYSERRGTYKGESLMDTFMTEQLSKDISACNSVEELKEKIQPILERQRAQWKVKINGIIAESGYTKKDFAEIAGVSRMTVHDWCNGSVPQGRERYMRIGLAAMYGEEQINRLLQRFGGYSGLYSKNLPDCVCLYVLKNYHGRDAAMMYNNIIANITEKMTHGGDGEIMSTVKMNEKLSCVKNESELEQFINENSATFATAYNKFYAYVMAHVKQNYNFDCKNILAMSEMYGWSASLRQSVYAVGRHEWIPTRNKMISVGMHLAMDHSEIDEMLGLAHMEPLCAKNAFESVIIYILEDAYRQGMLTSEAESYGMQMGEVKSYESDFLCEQARKIISYLNIPELNWFISEVADIEDDER
jgi:DNA-binding XRE family transcriptional regulator